MILSKTLGAFAMGSHPPIHASRAFAKTPTQDPSGNQPRDPGPLPPPTPRPSK